MLIGNAQRYSTVYEYEYLGDLQFHYRYDTNGNLATLTRVNADATTNTAYVICNSCGDVEELRTSSGALYARYIYDSWGNVLHVLNASGAEITSTTHFANQNPFRYRGYYYDIESGMYYLQSRYYDPVTGRFVNADKYMSTGTGVIGFNMYAYCLNNPIVYRDDSGSCPYNGTVADFHRLEQGLPSIDCTCYSKTLNSNSEIVSRSKKKPNMSPRKDKRHGSEDRQKTGARERNVKHPNGEEHSRVAKGNGIMKIQYGLRIGLAVALIAATLTDDLSGVGVANDALLPVFGKILWNSIKALC